jgi:hypothetical protein
MRIVYTIEIRTEVSPHDHERQEALIELFARAARALRTQCSMLSKGNPPTVRLVSNDSEHGEQDIFRNLNATIDSCGG